MTKNSQLIIFIEDLITSVTSTVTGDKSVRRCKKFFYSCPKSARNFLTNLRRLHTESVTAYDPACGQRQSSRKLRWPYIRVNFLGFDRLT